VIVVADGTRSLIPQWMLDPIACSAIVDRDSPVIAVPALQAIRELLDATGFGSRKASPFQGGPRDANTTNESPSVGVSVEPGGLGVESSAAGTAGTLPAASVPTASSSRDGASDKERLP
jgi:hypothetical protein